MKAGVRFSLCHVGIQSAFRSGWLQSCLCRGQCSVWHSFEQYWSGPVSEESAIPELCQRFQEFAYFDKMTPAAGHGRRVGAICVLCISMGRQVGACEEFGVAWSVNRQSLG